jgi:hypothetical protein
MPDISLVLRARFVICFLLVLGVAQTPQLVVGFSQQQGSREILGWENENGQTDKHTLGMKWLYVQKFCA